VEPSTQISRSSKLFIRQMTAQKKDISGLYLIAGLIVLAALAYAYHKWLQTLPQRYTVGVIYEIRKPAKGGHNAKFKYSIDGNSYSNSTSIGMRDRNGLVGLSFIVSVPEGHNDSGVLLWEYPLKSGVESPVEGWREMPDVN